MDGIIFDLTGDDSDDQDSAIVSGLPPDSIESEHQNHEQISSLTRPETSDMDCGESAGVTETQMQTIKCEDEVEVIQVPQTSSHLEHARTLVKHFDCNTVKTEEQMPDDHLGDDETFKNYYEPRIRRGGDSGGEGNSEDQIMQEPVMPIILCVETVAMSDDEADEITENRDYVDKEVKQEIDFEDGLQHGEDNSELHQEIADDNDSPLEISRISPVLPDLASGSAPVETTVTDSHENNQTPPEDPFLTDDKALLHKNLELDKEIAAIAVTDKDDSQLNISKEPPVLPDAAPVLPDLAPLDPVAEKDSMENNRVPLEDNKAVLHENLGLDKENAALADKNDSQPNIVKGPQVSPNVAAATSELPPVDTAEKGSPQINHKPFEDPSLTDDKALLRENLELDREIAAFTDAIDSRLNISRESPDMPASSPDLAPIESSQRDSPKNNQALCSQNPSIADDKALLHKTLTLLEKKTSGEVQAGASGEEKKLPVTDIFAFMNQELSSINNDHLTPSDCRKLLEDSTFEESDGDDSEEAEAIIMPISGLGEKQISTKHSVFEGAASQKKSQVDPVDCASSGKKSADSQKIPQTDPVDCASSTETGLEKKIPDSIADSKKSEDDSALLENPVQCLDCDYLAMNVQGLRTHTLSQHTTGRIYFCKKCKLKVSTGYDLKVHQMKVHPHLFAHKCHECGHATRRTDDMQRHLVIAHRDRFIGAATTAESILAMQKRHLAEEGEKRKKDGKRVYVYSKDPNRIRLKTLIELGKDSYFQKQQSFRTPARSLIDVDESKKKRQQQRRCRKKQLVLQQRQTVPKKKEIAGNEEDNDSSKRESKESAIKIKRRRGRPPNPLNLLKRQQQEEQRKREAMAANESRLSDSDLKSEQEPENQSHHNQPDGGTTNNALKRKRQRSTIIVDYNEDKDDSNPSLSVIGATLKRKKSSSVDYTDDKEDLLLLLDKFGGEADSDDATSELMMKRVSSDDRISKKNKFLGTEQNPKNQRETVQDSDDNRASESGGRATSPTSSKWSESSNQSGEGGTADQPKSELESDSYYTIDRTQTTQLYHPSKQNTTTITTTANKNTTIQSDPKHNYQSSSLKRLKCILCTFTYTSTLEFSEHTARRHPGRRWRKCPRCPFHTCHSNMLPAHVESAHYPKEGAVYAECRSCQYSTCQKKNMRRHQRIYHGQQENKKDTMVTTAMKTKTSGKTMTKRQPQQQHTRAGAGYVCKLCGYSCGSRHYTISKHCTGSHQKGRVCDACPNLGKFQDWPVLRRHFFDKHITKTTDVGNGNQGTGNQQQQQQQQQGGAPPPSRENVGLPKTTSKIETKSITVISDPGSSKIKLKFQTKSHIVDGHTANNTASNLSSEEEEEEESEECKTNVEISTSHRKTTKTKNNNNKKSGSSSKNRNSTSSSQNNNNNTKKRRRNKRKRQIMSEDEEDNSEREEQANGRENERKRQKTSHDDEEDQDTNNDETEEDNTTINNNDNDDDDDSSDEDSPVKFKCPKCPHRARFQYYITKHMQNVHTPDHEREWHACAVCPFKSKTKTNAVSHMIYMHTDRSDRCFMCKSGVAFRNLRHHVRSQHKTKIARMLQSESKQERQNYHRNRGRNKSAKQHLLSAHAKLEAHQNLSPKIRKQLDKTKKIAQQKTNASQQKRTPKTKRKRDLDLSMPRLEKMVEEILQPGSNNDRTSNMTAAAAVQKVLKNPQITVKKEMGAEKPQAAPSSSGNNGADTKRWYKCGHCTYKSLDTQSLTAHMLSHMNPTENVTLSISSVHKSTANNPSTISSASASANSFNQISSLPEKSNFPTTDGASNNDTGSGDIGTGSSSGPDKVYRCFQCDFHTKNKYLLAAHINCHHLPDEQVTWYRCPCCEFKNKRKSYTYAHVRTKHPHVKRCPQCWYFANSARELDEHKEKIHLAIPNEIRTADGLKLYTCNQQDCTQMYSLRASAVRHIKTAHFGQIFNTSTEDSGCSNIDQSNDDSNKKSSSEAPQQQQQQQLYKCFKCPYVGKKVSCLKSHMTKSHKNKAKDSLEGGRLIGQAERHAHVTGEEPRQDQVRGANESSFDCDACPYSTTLYKFYETHMKVAHGRHMAKK